MLMTLFDKFEGKPSSKAASLNKPATSSYMQPTTTIKLLLMPDQVKSKVSIGFRQTLGDLRNKISQEFNLPLTQFELVGNNNKLIDRDEDENTISESYSKYYGQISGLLVVKRIASSLSDHDFHPKNMIAENQLYLDLLFKLLSSNIQSECINNVWDLLMKLPTNESIKRTIFEAEQTFE